ncbi:MAG: CapA family protein [Herbinix sp.]|nr:CapA family protein [Herbinix sp.]
MKKSRIIITLGKMKIYLGIFTAMLIMLPLSGCHAKSKIEPIVVEEENDTELAVDPTKRVLPKEFSKEAFSTAMSDDVITSTEDSSRVTLLAVGDNLIHLQVIESGEQKDGSYNYDHLYANIKNEISAADIAVINQETILGGDDFSYSGYPNFNSPTEIGDAIINAGFDVVLQATNHTMDMGYKGIENTLAYWDKHPDIKTLGINESEEESEQINIIEKNGIKIAMLNYTYGLNGYHLPDGMPYLVNILDKEKMSEDIKKAEEQADFTIVFPHWGTEYSYVPDKTQDALTQCFYDNGVDLVIGSHPHVLEPVDWIETTPGHRMLVYYSLGNYMSYQKEAPRMLGGMASVTITKDTSGTYISDSSIIPIVTHYENGPADYNYAIYELDDYTSELAKLHGVSEIAQDGPFTYEGICNLANEVLGSWYPE